MKGDQRNARKSEHGGKRPGAGRKKKVRSATSLDEADVRILVDRRRPIL